MAVLYVIAVLLILLCPLCGVLYALGEILNKFAFHSRKWGTLIIVGFGAVLLVIGILFDVRVIPLELFKNFVAKTQLFDIEYTPVSVWQWIISDCKTLGVSVILVTSLLSLARLTPERMMIKAEQRRERKKRKLKDIDYIPKTSQLCFGVSGAGKSAFIGKSLDEIICNDPNAFCLICDGKGSTEKFSLYYSLQIIARKYGKRLVILNGTANDNIGGCVYDFLDGVEKADAAKDMIMALITDPTVEKSAGAEHFKVMTESYILTVIEFMKRHNIDVTLMNAIQLLTPENLLSVAEQNHADPDEQAELRKLTEESWQDVAASVTKLKMFIRGQGKNIFVGSGEQLRTNIRKAYANGDIVLVLADEMSMPTLAQKLVQLVTMDLRNLVAGRLTGTIDMNNKVYSFFDEFSGYASALPIIKSLYARARSAEVIMSLASQSCSDIIGLGNGWFEILCDTADRFVIFRQHSAEAAEAASGIFGTEIHVTATARSSEFMFTGESSNTLDRAFVVSPDTIRNLPVNHGILYDKKAGTIQFFKNKFITEN